MVNFKNIKEHEVETLDSWTFLGSLEDYNGLSIEFKDQIKFLNKEASDFLYKFFDVSQFHTGPMWEPFQKGNFKYVDQVSLNEDENVLRKWLYNRGIPFSKWVYVLPNYGKGTAMMTWKMIIKNSESLFFGDDIVVFDETNQWCLSYWHEDEMFFGRTNIIDPEIGYNEFEEMNKLERKHPNYKHPLKP